ncbi:MAG: nicotinamide riboside transporter PnuC [Tunicatimonas sp.]
MEINWIEVLAVLFGLVAVYFNTQENVWGWPVGIVGVVLSGILFYEVRLYSDLILHVMYVILGFYGWYEWLYGGQNNAVLRVSTLSPPMILRLLVLGAAGTGVIGYLFDRYTDADLAYWDAFTTSFSLVGQYMLAKKKLENWLLWIGVDAVATGIYFYKELYLLSLLYFVYLGLAAYGYRRWKKTLAYA